MFKPFRRLRPVAPMSLSIDMPQSPRQRLIPTERVNTQRSKQLAQGGIQIVDLSSVDLCSLTTS